MILAESEVEIIKGLFDDLSGCGAHSLLLDELLGWLTDSTFLRSVSEQERVLDERAGLRFEEWACLTHSCQTADELFEKVLVRDLDLKRLRWQVGCHSAIG